jgi:putative ABC transport system permease protein
MDLFVHDCRVALRGLARVPLFTLAIVATLAIAIGANTAVFSLVNGVLLRALPFRSPDRLVSVVDRRLVNGQHSDRLSPADFVDWRRQIRGLEGLAGYENYSANLTGGSEPWRLATASVTANWFSLLGVQPEIGRTFGPDEDRPDAQKVVVISDAIWRTHFGASRGIIGTAVRLDDTVYTVIGVAPPRFTFPGTPDVWLPLIFQSDQLGPNAREWRVLQAVGRLAPSVSVERARREVQIVDAGLRERYRAGSVITQYDLVPLREQIVGDARPALLVLLGAVACVLLIACGNVANLMLVRATGRSMEIGIRMALGAGRRQLVRQLLIESLLLALVGGVIGAVLAIGGVHALVGAPIGAMPRIDDVTVDGRVLAFSAIVTVMTGVLLGLAPALQSTSTDVVQALKTGTRTIGVRRRTGRLRSALVVSEMALAVPLLIGAGLLGRSFIRLTAVDPGFRPDHSIRFDVSLPITRFDSTDSTRMRVFVDEVVRRLRGVSGTQFAAAGVGAPFAPWGVTWFDVRGRSPAPSDRPNIASTYDVTADYFKSLGVRVQRGRAFSEFDRAGGHPVAIVNQALADRIFPGEDPIGQTLTSAPYEDAAGKRHVDVVGEIVGIVGNTKDHELSAPARPSIYTPYDQSPGPYVTFIVRSLRDPRATLAAAKAQVAAVEPTVPIFNARSFEDVIQTSVAGPRFDAGLVSAFAFIALCLAIIGIYGVIAFAVRERRRELGIRVALGAQSGQVVGLILGYGMRLAGIGVSIGLGVAVVGNRMLGHLLFGIGSTDPTTYAWACGVLVVVAAVASLVPALRAGRVDPVIAMRLE